MSRPCGPGEREGTVYGWRVGGNLAAGAPDPTGCACLEVSFFIPQAISSLSHLPSRLVQASLRATTWSDWTRAPEQQWPIT